ncbi:MAG: HAMP domain-containing sensor histidine kinase [Solirubrobacteraceae bacterium]
MKTGSLRFRVSLTTLALLAIVLAGVVAAVTLVYRAKLDGDLRGRLTHAASAIHHASPLALKSLVPGLALEGIAIRAGPAAGPRPGGTKTPLPAQPGSTIETHGRLLILDDVLRDGTPVAISASRRSIDHAVTTLLLVELLVVGAAAVLAVLLVLRGTHTALRPLSTVIDTATRIAQGDSNLRLNPSRTDTELGSLAHAFDRMVDSLASAVDEARASNAATRRFLADASHELRTPIAALQASVETLLREQPERPDRDRLEAAVAREAERLGRLVNDLLGLARLEARPTRTPVDLETIARPLVAGAKARAPRATITLTADADAVVCGDPDALERIMRNLLDNALAAIEPGGRVDVQLRRLDAHVEALVTDDGPGVPETERERIFERFVRLDPGKPGHGLGLAIAQRIARQHNGELTCDSVPAGASFTVHLPT